MVGGLTYLTLCKIPLDEKDNQRQNKIVVTFFKLFCSSDLYPYYPDLTMDAIKNISQTDNDDKQD